MNIRLTGLVTLKPLKEASNDKAVKSIEKIAKLTDSNNHTEAALELAKLIGNKKWIKVLESIDDIQDAVGHLPSEIGQYRNSVLTQLFTEAEKKFDKITYNELRQAF